MDLENQGYCYMYTFSSPEQNAIPAQATPELLPSSVCLCIDSLQDSAVECSYMKYRDCGGGGATVIARIFFSRAPDGMQMPDKWQNTSLNVCLWLDWLALPL